MLAQFLVRGIRRGSVLLLLIGLAACNSTPDKSAYKNPNASYAGGMYEASGSGVGSGAIHALDGNLVW